jgi:hypothetical protein
MSHPDDRIDIDTVPGVGDIDLSRLPRPLRALHIARSHLHEREQGGKNCGPIVDFSVERFTRRRPGQGHDPDWAQWCAGFAWRCELDAGQELGHKDLYEYLSCRRSWARVATLPGYQQIHDVADAQPGDLIWFGGDRPSHMGRVDHVDLDKRMLFTIEGNAGCHADRVALVVRDLQDDQVLARIFGLARPPR